MRSNTMQKVEWRVQYTDGTSLFQYNEGEENKKYTDIDRDRLKEFSLFVDNVRKIVIPFDGNKRLVYRKRITRGFIGYTQGRKREVYIAGWQEKRDGKNIQMLCFLFDDGHVEILDKFDINHVWSIPVTFTQEERL